MKLKLFLCMIASIVRISSSSCLLSGDTYTKCDYEIICNKYTSRAPNPDCEGTEPSVTLTIEESNQVVLSKRFFASTNFDARVKTIRGINNNWNRITENTFRYYINCVSMDLSNNNIEEIDSKTFVAVFSLKNLNLSSNNIVKVNPESFYVSQDRNYGIEVLDLSNNKITEISTEFHILYNLKELYLENNNIVTIDDEAFLYVINLNYLNLRFNKLASLNFSLSSLKRLATLDISWNNLTELKAPEINRLIKIVDFNISHNSIHSIDNNCFDNANLLKSVDLSFNKINISIQNTTFVVNNNLEYLNFYNNCITGVEDTAFEYNRLNYINLENNCIHGEIKENTFLGLANITSLDLSRQNITGIKAKAFEPMKSLLNLNLSRNSIQIIESTGFLKTFIAVLDLSYNSISNVSFMESGLFKIVELYLNNNKIKEIQANSFLNQIEIKKLDLSMNYIVNIEPNSLPLQSLQYLYLIGNNLQGIIKKNTFSPAKFLRFLNLSSFNITSIDDSAFVDLPGLARLNLSNNQIDSIASNNFNGVDNMFSLDLSYNNLKELNLNSSSILKKLSALYLNNNKLINISNLFQNKCKLTYLELSNNNLKENFMIGSDILPNITVLRLAGNKIQRFNNPQTNSLLSLIDLVLSSNMISEIKLDFFKELMTLELSDNNLEYINYTLLAENTFLQALDVSRNQIKELPPGTFKDMKNLKLLNISGNFIKTLRYGSLKGLRKTEVLDLSKNIIADLDIEVFHECTELKTLIIDYNRIKMFDVHRLIYVSVRNLKKLSLGGNPISCKVIFDNVKYENVSYYTTRQVEVTSIDKVYHEDNVHGIQCGDKLITSTVASVSTSPATLKASLSSTSITLIWCLVLTIVFVAFSTVVYIKVFKKRITVVSNVPLRNSLDLTGSEFGQDLLG